MGAAAGDYTPVTEVEENVVRLYVQEVKHKHEESFAPFKRLFKKKKVSLVNFCRKLCFLY